MYIISWPVRHDFHTSLPSTGRRDTDREAVDVPSLEGLKARSDGSLSLSPTHSRRKELDVFPGPFRFKMFYDFSLANFFFSGSQPTPKMNGGTKKRRDTPLPWKLWSSCVLLILCIFS